MPLNQTSEKRLAEVHPVLKTRLEAVSAQFEEAFPDYAIQISQGLRSWNLQAAYYAQGREPLAQVNDRRQAVGLAPITEEENQATVTNAEAGFSNHEFGYAGDWDIQNENGSLDWNASDPMWQKLISLAAPNKLRSGACYSHPDKPHMELIEVPEVPTDEMRQAFIEGGVETVWNELNLS